MIAYLKLGSAEAWTALYRLHFAVELDGEWVPRFGVQVDEIGTIHHIDGPSEGPVPGWHVNVIAPEIPAEVYPFLVNPQRPKRVYFMAEVLSMPEPLPEAGGTAMVERPVGRPAPDEVIARIERAVLRGRLDAETAADRIELIRANLALVDAREAAGPLRTARDAARTAHEAAIAARDQATAARTALVDERDAQQAIRADAIARLATLTGAARAPEVARRDAAVAEINRLAPLIEAATAERQARITDAAGTLAALDAARDAVEAANAEIVRLRAARDALRAPE